MADTFKVRKVQGTIVAEGPFDDVILIAPESLSYAQRPGFIVRKQQVFFMAPDGETVEYKISGWDPLTACLILVRHALLSKEMLKEEFDESP